MERDPLQATVAVGVLALAGLAALAFLVAGPGGAIVLATLVVVAGCGIAAINWTRRPIEISEEQPESAEPHVEAMFAGETLVASEGSTPGEMPARQGERSQSRAAARTSGQTVAFAIAGYVGAVFAFFLLRGLTANPVALFCDEAEIGLETFRLLHRRAETTTVPLFYQHFGYEFGTLPLFTTAPFVALLGMSDFAVRLAAALPMVLTIPIIFLTLRRLRTPYAVVPVAAYAFSPVVLHLSRANFGQGPAMLLVAIGFDRWVAARQTGRTRTALIAGLCFGLSAYGNPSFLLVTPVIVGALLVSEVLFNRRQLREFAAIGWMTSVVALCLSPIAIRAVTNEQFWQRLREKNLSETPLLSSARLHQVIDNYPKYFSGDYLFRLGESGLPDAVVTRHSVPGAGTLGLTVAPLLVLAVVTLAIRWRLPETRFFLPWFIVAVLYPGPDLLTTTTDSPPYTVALFGTLICVPYLGGYAMHGLRALVSDGVSLRRAEKPEHGAAGGRAVSAPVATTLAALLLIWTMIAGWRFETGPYRDYPNVSADYWGWQFGPKAMIDYFIAHQDEYDEFIMDGDFNEAYVFLDYYLRDSELRARASIGDLSRLDLTKRQLFGMRRESWDALPGSQVAPKSYFIIDSVIEYPDGSDAMYLLEAR